MSAASRTHSRATRHGTRIPLPFEHTLARPTFAPAPSAWQLEPGHPAPACRWPK